MKNKWLCDSLVWTWRFLAGNLLSASTLRTEPPSTPKNKVEKSGMFLVLAGRQFPTTFNHAFHHVLTIKKPRSTTCFFQNPPQKHQQNAEIPRRRRLRIFF
ncbi:MAG TPA: hypothetical protein VGG81_13125 [Edaphobacter sp.]